MSMNFNQMKHTTQCAIRCLLQDNFKKSELLTVDQVPVIHKEPFIYTGYRHVYKPWKYYVQSILHLHNETLNIWTHLIGFFLLLFYLVATLNKYDVINDKPAWPLLIFGVCSLATLLLSTIAHLLHSKSPWHHYAFYMLDYAAIAANGYGNGVAAILISSSPWFRERFYLWHIIVSVFVGSLTFLVMCLSNTSPLQDENKHKKWRFIAVVAQALFSFLPVLPRYMDCFRNPGYDFCPLPHVTIFVLLDIASAISYSALLPERFAGGRCDIFGHSHQLFHVFVAAAMLLKVRGLQIDIQFLNISEKVFPSIATLAFALLAFTVSVVSTYVYFILYVPHPMVKRKVKRNTS